MKVSLRTKIMGLILSLLIIVIGLLAGVFAYMEKRDVEDQVGQLALQVASTVSFMPTIKEAFDRENPSEIIQPIALSVQRESGAEFIVVGNKHSIRYAHPDEWKIGRRMVGGDNERALNNGEYYISKAEGTLGPSLRGKAPIIGEDGEIIGIVSVGFLLEDVRTIVWNKLENVFGVAVLVLVVGAIGSLLLARSIRKDTLGLEPHEITSFYQTREAILSSIKEGIISIDAQGKVTMINQSAIDLLNLSGGAVGRLITEVFPNTEMLKVLKTGVPTRDDEMILRDKVVIVNRTPITHDGKVAGVVSSFRDKTEVRDMVQALSEVKRHSEGLRSQTHEHANKMYVLLGLLQLGKQEEAVAMIEEEYHMSQKYQTVIFDQIQDETVQAILTGKMSRASEKKINFSIHEESELERMPDHINRADIVTMLGNIIDNAFEAVSQQNVKKVDFFVTDMGEDIVFEVTDNGPGIPDDVYQRLFMRGFSTKKGELRGYGLANVREVIERRSGMMEVTNGEKGGAVFSIFLPKNTRGEADEGDDQRG
ncbi:Sensor protein CitS [Halobacillus karajensis]|uniref:histidine kinase n=1 Tax=Halobacillus karajensis TaxID=195088 RepID=A0A024P2S3_9BACI|nr:Sensor protein CitS [Halobacillus karajensis]CDQ22798.1 Sensor protein CitS [Halobacillus karajensis]CDQ26280.1 Sensor protein CitS [Halobacillus karajensis]